MEQDIKDFADKFMVENGFYPVRLSHAGTGSSINLDGYALAYKCQNKRCTCPYETIFISGLEIMQLSGPGECTTKKSVENLVKERCNIIGKIHNCEMLK